MNSFSKGCDLRAKKMLIMMAAAWSIALGFDVRALLLYSDRHVSHRPSPIACAFARLVGVRPPIVARPNPSAGPVLTRNARRNSRRLYRAAGTRMRWPCFSCGAAIPRGLAASGNLVGRGQDGRSGDS